MSDLLSQCPVIPVVAIDDASKAVGLCEALLSGGINAVEVTLRTPQALNAIENIKKECPDMILGVGTIVTPSDVKNSENAGADFLVSPGLSPELKTAFQETNLLALPGTASPTEAMSAYEAGFKMVKLFPAEAVGGVALLKSIHAPLPLIKFMPTGGIRLTNMLSYYNLPNVYSIGGTWIAPMDDINAGNWTKIKENAQQAMELIESNRA